MRTFVIVPTIDGREDVLGQTLAAWRAQEFDDLSVTAVSTDVELVVVHNRPSIGEAWQAGIEEVADCDPDDAILLAADDLVPSPTALEWGLLTIAGSQLPSPAIYERDGSLHSCGSFGAGQLVPYVTEDLVVGTSPLPLFYRADLPKIGQIPPIHYYADDFVSWRLKQESIACVAVPEYRFVHLEGTVGRERHVQRSAQDRAAFIAAVGESRMAAA